MLFPTVCLVQKPCSHFGIAERAISHFGAVAIDSEVQSLMKSWQVSCAAGDHGVAAGEMEGVKAGFL